MSSNQPNPSPPPSPAAAAVKGSKNSGGGAFYGMLRKTRKKTYSALRGGGRRNHRNANLLQGDADGDSSDSSAEVQALNFAPGARNGSSRSPFTPRMGTGGGGTIEEPSRSFYFSPLNSWHGHQGHGQQNASAPAAGTGTRNGSFGFGNVHTQIQHQSDESLKSIVLGVERILRQVVMCCAMFIAGTVMSDKAHVAYHALELSMVSWGTCLLIVALGWYQSYNQQQMMHQGASAAAQSAPTPLADNPARTTPLMGPPAIERVDRATISPPGEIFMGSSPNETEPTTQTEISKKRSFEESSEPADDIKPPSSKVMREAAIEPTRAVTPTEKRPQQHPQLENLYVMMVDEQKRIIPNGIAYDIDSDLFTGKMLLMFRTPEVDDPAATTDPVVNYFRGKQRRFEFQWQLRLKKVPEGEVFLGAEIDEPIQMGIIQRALANAALKFTKKMNQGFSYHFSDSSENPSYLSFPVGTSMDRFSATKLGEPLPVLGQEVIEDPGQMKDRKKGTKIEWRTDHIYTMALFSAYIDWSSWQILNFPGIRPFSLTSMIGEQPILLTLFTTPSSEMSEKNPTRNTVFSMEVSNAAKATLGSAARYWSTKNAETEETQAVEIGPVETEAVEPSEMEFINGNETFDEDEEDEDMDLDDDDDLIKPMYEEDLDEEEEEEALDMDNLETSCYLLSGTSISLREGTGNYVASGGGYAVLASISTSSIVLEKFHPKKKKGAVHGPSMMIRSGDVVRVKLVDVNSKAVKYLALHRGWWLKWVSARPKKNGLFKIHTGEPIGSLVVLGCPFSLVSRRWSHYLIGACVESSAKYGGRMLGIYKTGKKSMEDEAGDEEEGDDPMEDNELDDKKTFKRMMPLLLCAEAYHCPQDLSSPAKSPTRASKLSKRTSAENDLPVPVLGASGTEQVQRTCDVPVWLEVMNRTKRSKQLVYAVRVKETVLPHNDGSGGQESEIDSGAPESSQPKMRRMLCKLRTGRDLAPILRLGAEYNSSGESPSSEQWQQRFDFHNQEDELNDADSFSSSSDDSDSDDEELDDDMHFLIAGTNHAVDQTFASDQGDFAKVFPDEDAEDQGTTPTQQKLSASSAVESEISPVDDSEKPTRKDTSSSGDFAKYLPAKIQREKSGDSETVEDCTRRGSSMSASDSRRGSFVRANSLAGVPNLAFGQGDINTTGMDRQVSTDSKKKSRGKAAIGRVAKTVKSSTVVTGKHVIAVGKGTVKGTVSAGKAAGRIPMIPASVVYSYKPPKKHEPGGRVTRKGSDKNQMKMLRTAIKNVEDCFSTSLLSGQLLAPDQSARKVSQILFDISTTPNKAAQDALALLAKTNSTQDLAFLRGSSAELGVKPLKSIDSKSDVECVVARCVYEGRWREELCVLYTKGAHLAFYAPLAKKPSLVVSFDEIISARKCQEDTELSPLPGLYTLAIETAWRIHYFAFLETTKRDSFLKRLNDALFHTDNESNPQQTKVAQEFGAYRMSLETILTGPAGKWRAVSTGKKSKQKRSRRILNGRRMAFDLDAIADKDGDTDSDAQEKVASYAENLLRMALSFSPNTLDASCPRFIEFLDQTSRLRTLPLHKIDLSSRGALCIFVNIYHCLLQHSLLLALDGLPNKRSVGHFKRCSCYEIGEDVFSLAELECCVIRGKTSRPLRGIKPPFVDAPKNSRPYRMIYGLGQTDFRINFILNNGDLAYPSAVPVLQQQRMDDQIEQQASWFLTQQVKIDERKRTVFLPKVCDIYRNDFGMGDGVVCLSQCMMYLNNEIDQLTIESLLEEGVVSVKFQRAREEFHPNLTEST